MRYDRVIAVSAASVIGLGGLGFLAACAKAIEPKLELRSSAQNLADAKQASFTVEFAGDADHLIAAIEKDDPSAFTTDDAATLKKIFNSSVTVAYDKAGDGADDDRGMLAATIGGVAGTELRVVDGTLYLKAPVKQLAELFDVNANQLDEARADAAGVVPGIDDGFDGKWVSVSKTDLETLPNLTGLPVTEQDLHSGKYVTELRTSAENLLNGAEVTRDGNDATHLVATTSVRKVHDELVRLVKVMQPAVAEGLMESAPKQDRQITVDLWVDDNQLTAVEVDLVQFVDGATGRAAVRVEVGTGQAIDAPPAATKLDLSSLTDQMGLVAPGTTEIDLKHIAKGLDGHIRETAAATDVQPGPKQVDQAAKETAQALPTVTVTSVGPRKVELRNTAGKVVCLTLSGNTRTAGTVTAGGC